MADVEPDIAPVAKRIEPFELIECSTAKEFLSTLQPFHEAWQDSSFPVDNPWMYRGHWDAEWELTPAAWRDDGQRRLALISKHSAKRVEYLTELYANDLDTRFDSRKESTRWTLQYLSEMAAVRGFFLEAEAQGLEVPAFDRDSRYRPMLAQAGYSSADWPFEIIYSLDQQALDATWNSEVLETIALAQHHGIPTRLLDWTRNPRIAAYFSVADDQRSENPTSKCVAVWALNFAALPIVRLKDLQIPRFRNAYLHDAGVAFHILLASRNGVMVVGVPFVAKRARTLREMDRMERWSRPPLRKITMPRTEADNLLTMLRRENITRARLMPTYDSVARSVETSWRLYDRQLATAENASSDQASGAIAVTPEENN